MPKINFTFYGNPVPAQRPRFGGKSKRPYTPEAYRIYKNQLRQALLKEYPPLQQITDDKLKRKYKRDTRYRLTVLAYRADNRACDGDNILKTAQDALQDSGVIFDDSQIDDARVLKSVDTKNPRLTLILNDIDDTVPCVFCAEYEGVVV